MDVRVSPEAEVQLAERRAWWRAHRDEVDVFDEDLALAVARIGQSPTAFPWFGIRAGRLIRRCLMERARCHLRNRTPRAPKHRSDVSLSRTPIGSRRRESEPKTRASAASFSSTRGPRVSGSSPHHRAGPRARLVGRQPPTGGAVLEHRRAPECQGGHVRVTVPPGATESRLPPDDPARPRQPPLTTREHQRGRFETIPRAPMFP
jgi:hypothetical protein